MLAKLKRALKIIRSEGPGVAWQKVRRRQVSHSTSGPYQRWIREFDTFSADDDRRILDEIEHFARRPTISLLMPVYNTDKKWLRTAIESVIDQSYPHWELCIADDCSTKAYIRGVLGEYARADERIKIVFRESNGNISAASNSALELATGEYTALLDHDDELSPHALYFVAKEIDAYPGADLIYSDEDMIDMRGRRFYHKFKPDWSPEFFYCLNMLSHLSVFRTQLLAEVGGFRLGYEGSQDYDLALRVIEKIPATSIRHIPRILYHWRAVPGSIAHSSDEKPLAHERARMAITEHFERTGSSGRSVRGIGELHRSVYELPGDAPLVSIISAVGDDGRRLIDEIVSKTGYARFELVLIGPDTDVVVETERVKTIHSHGTSRYAMLSEAAGAAAGDVLCFLDPSTIPRSREWLFELVGQALQPGIGAVGAKVVFPDDTIKHAGFVLGINGGVGRAHYRHHANDPGYFVRLCNAQNFSAVSIDCMATRRSVFEDVGGFDAERFGDHYGDVDLCLRLLEKGYRNVWTPWAEVIQADEPERDPGAELELMKARWMKYFERDRFYNPNLTLAGEDFSLAFPPRTGKF